MSSSATFKATIGSTLGVINNTATSAVAVVDTLNVGVAMVKLAADDALMAQRARSHANRKDLLLNVGEEVKRKRAMLNMDIQTWKKQSAEHAAAYEEAAKHYENLWEDFTV